MATYYSVYEDSTGDLIMCGFCDFAAGVPTNHTQRTDLPHPGKCRGGDPDEPNMSRWNGSAWVEVAKP